MDGHINVGIILGDPGITELENRLISHTATLGPSVQKYEQKTWIGSLDSETQTCWMHVHNRTECMWGGFLDT